MKEKVVSSIFILLFCFSRAQNPLYIPDTLSGPNYSLTLHSDSMQFFPGTISHTYAFNSNRYLGPTLIFNKGTQISITINNQISDTTSLHWHGIHLPAKWDGGPHSEILPGDSSIPQFMVLDHAATYWYHPHPDMKTAEQAIRGAAGLIIVRDNEEQALNLPRRYGIDDFPIIAQCQQYDAFNQAMPRGMEDSTLLVNGTINPYLDIPAQVIRLRLLNASGERVFNFGFTSNFGFSQIASDGGLLSVPYSTTRARLAPGERAEVLLNLSGMNGQTLYLMSYASELPIGVQGGPTMPMPPWSPPMDSPLNGIDFNILRLNVISPTTDAITSIPSALVANTPYLESQANAFRRIEFTADSIMVMDGPFYFNDSTFDMMRVDFQIPLNSTEVWTLKNSTMVAHPFHIHDVQFYLLDRNGNPPSAGEQGRKDVVLVPSMDSVRFITKFTDFSDTVVPNMFHCHILMHEDDGMMGQFVVLNSGVGMQNQISAATENLLYPNPSTNKITWKSSLMFEHAELSIWDVQGRKCFQDIFNHTNSFTSDVSTLPPGIYFMELKTGDKIFTQKFVKRKTD